MPGPKNIVIAEADVPTAEALRRLLLASGSDAIRVFPNLAAAEAAMAKEPAEVLLLVLEASRVVDQVKAARELQARTNGAVIFVADEPAGAELAKLGSVPPSGYVLLPVQGRELWLAIDAVVRMRKIEQRLHRLESRLRDVQRLESIGLVAGAVAHDFNNLITGIYGAVALASGELPESSPARQRLDHIERAASRAADLCQRLVVPPGSRSSLRVPVSVNEVAEEALQLAQEGLPSGVAVQTGFASNLPLVPAVEAQVRQAVLNLVANSTEAITPGSGMIRVLAFSRHLDEATLAALTVPGEAKPGNFVVLEVADTGCGIGKGLFGRLFDPLYSTKGPNRGLGLAAVARIMRRHAGAIDVDSSVGHGTSFRLFFPVQTPNSNPPLVTTLPAAATPAAEPARTILVVDDDEAVRMLAAWVIEKEGFPVVTARDGDEAVRLFAAEPNKFMLAMLDLTMPRMGGWEAMQKIRNVKPDQQVIIVTGHGESLVADELRGQEVEFLQKPFTPEQLREVMERYRGKLKAG